MAGGEAREMFRPSLVLGDKEQQVLAVFENLVAADEENYIDKDAERFLNKIQELGKTAVILTFGDPNWQRAKVNAILGASGYDLPVVYTEEKIKSKVLRAAWSEKEQAYKLGSATAENIVGVGDEQADFVGYEELANAKGYLKNAKHSKLSVPADNVVHVRSLDEIELSE
jgi:hypothetical protein